MPVFSKTEHILGTVRLFGLILRGDPLGKGYMKRLENALYVDFDEKAQTIYVYTLWNMDQGVKRNMYGEFPLSRLEEIDLHEAYQKLGEAIVIGLKGPREYIVKKHQK